MIAASVAVTLLLAAGGAMVLPHLPGSRLPIHWNASGVPDRYGPARLALFLPAALAGGLSLLMGALPYIEPLQHRLDQSAVLYRTSWALMLAMTILLAFQLDGQVLGLAMPWQLMLAMPGIGMIVIGNVLPKSRPGFFVGYRTPWALADRDNWIATHRIASWVAIAIGVVWTVAAFLPLAGNGHVDVIRFGVAAYFVPYAYSFWYWRRHRHDPAGSQPG